MKSGFVIFRLYRKKSKVYVLSSMRISILLYPSGTEGVHNF